MFAERPKKSSPACLVPTVKYGGVSVMIWAAISWYSAGPKTTLNGRINSCDYVDILCNQLHSGVQMLFPNHDAIFQGDNWPIHTVSSVQSLFQEHEEVLKQLPWPAR
jgi:hypothetical protein